MPTGAVQLDFGAFPGKTDAVAVVTGQSAITASSFVEAWIAPDVTTEHSADEHWVDPPAVVAGNIVAGTGFTIYGVTRDHRRKWGKWNVDWVWT